MKIKQWLKQVKAFVYFASLPFGNYIVNPLLHKQFSGAYIPKVFYIEVTNYCNAKCYMCPHEKLTRERGYMPLHIFTKIVDECTEFEGSGLSFFLHKDGEPLMDPLLFKRIEYIKKTLKKSTVHFNTNTSLLNEENISKILDSPLDSITFSVDGASKTTYEHVRTGLNYEMVKRNIENFFDKRKSSGKKIHVIMQMVVDKSNIHEIPTYRKLWEDKADEVFFKSMHNFLVQKTSIHSGGLSEKQLRKCKMPFLVMLFYWNGDVGLCCWDYDHISKLGNIEDDSLLKIYNSAKFEEIREAIRRKDCKKIKPCNVCSAIYGIDGSMCEEL